jgi:hypothetical protein
VASVVLFGLIGWLTVGGDLRLAWQPPDQNLVHETGDRSEDTEPPLPASPAEPPSANASSQGSDATSGNLWLDAPTETATVGPVDVRDVSVRVGTPRIVLDSERVATSSQESLIVTLELTNTGNAQSIVYAGWGGASAAQGGVLFDGHGTTYKAFYFAQGKVEGQQNDVPLRADEPQRDLLVFERPDESVEFLRLLLPASALGHEGTIRFEIPRDMIRLNAHEAEGRLADSQTDGPLDVTAEPASDGLEEEKGQQLETARTPVPSPSEQQEIRRVLDEVYDTTASRDREEKRALADQLTALAEEAENEAERFVFLRRASDLATEGGDAVQMLELVDRIAVEFEVDRLSAQAFMLNGFANRAVGEEELRA